MKRIKKIKRIAISTTLIAIITLPILAVLSCDTNKDSIKQTSKLNNELDKIIDHPDNFYEVTDKAKNTLPDDVNISEANINEYVKNLPKKNSNINITFEITKRDIILGTIYLKIIMSRKNEKPIKSNIKKISGFKKLDLTDFFVDNLKIFNNIEEINIHDIKDKLIIQNEKIFNLKVENIISINVSKIEFLNDNEIKLFFNFIWENANMNLEQILIYKIKKISQLPLNIYPLNKENISKIYASQINNENINTYINIPKEKYLSINVKEYDDKNGELSLSIFFHNQEEHIKIIKGFKIFKSVYIEQGIFKYYIKDNQFATIYGYSNNINDDKLVIPDNVTWDNKVFIIDEIGEAAFINKNLSEVTFSNNIKIINTRAFRANKIKKLVFPDSIKEIGFSSFSNNIIDEIIFSDQIEIIQSNAFNNSRVGKINFLPSKLKELGSYAFFMNNLKDIKLNHLIPKVGNDPFTYKNIPSFTYSDQLTNQIKYNKYNFAMSILNETDISINGFINNKNDISELIIPSIVLFNNNKYNVTQIGSHAFGDLDYDLVTIPSSVTSIGSKAFAISKIKKLNIPNNFEDNKINENVLSYKILNDDEVEITGFLRKSSNVLTIPAFLNINNKKYNVTSIGPYSFIDYALNEINIPNSVTSIKYGAFSHNKETDNNIIWNIPTWFILNNNVKIFFNILSNNKIKINQIYTNKLFNGNLILPDEIWVNNSSKEINTIGFYAIAFLKVQILKLPKYLEIIDSYAIINNLIENINIPYGTTSIGSYAFIQNKIENVEFKNYKENILINTFAFDEIVKISYL